MESALITAIDADAREVAISLRQGGWRNGLLVARNVEHGRPGRPPKMFQRETFAGSNKVSASEFARRGGKVSGKRTEVVTILRVLAAWENAAEDGWVPHASKLFPTKEVKLDVDKLPPWDDYYKEVIKEATTPKRKSPLPQSGSGGHIMGSESEVGRNPLFCTPNRSAAEFIQALHNDLNQILAPLPIGYHLSIKDLEKLKTILAAALEIAEKYEPLEWGESKGAALRHADKGRS